MTGILGLMTNAHASSGGPYAQENLSSTALARRTRSLAGACVAGQRYGAYPYPCADLAQSRCWLGWASLDRCDDQLGIGCRALDCRSCASDCGTTGTGCRLAAQIAQTRLHARFGWRR